MLIDIDRIVVGDRIRKDFGDIDELAEDIRVNGLINPPVVNRDYVLLAGERRLRACKILGWPQIEVRMMDTRDAEHELNVEISENDVRKGFTKAERVDYMRRLLRIEQAKAAEREKAGVKNPSENSHKGRSDESTARQFGISSNTMRREMAIVDHADLLDPADFADWDEGRLSTNRAFQRVKAAQAQAEQERDKARSEVETIRRVGDTLRHERDEARADLEDAQREIQALEKQNDELYELASTQQVVTREVTVEVVPEDYDDLRKSVRELESANRLYASDNKSLREQLESASDGTADHERLLDAARIEAASFKKKFASLSELSEVLSAIDRFLSI